MKQCQSATAANFTDVRTQVNDVATLIGKI